MMHGGNVSYTMQQSRVCKVSTMSTSTLAFWTVSKTCYNLAKYTGTKHRHRYRQSAAAWPPSREQQQQDIHDNHSQSRQPCWHSTLLLTEYDMQNCYTKGYRWNKPTGSSHRPNTAYLQEQVHRYSCQERATLTYNI